MMSSFYEILDKKDLILLKATDIDRCQKNPTWVELSPSGLWCFIDKACLSMANHEFEYKIMETNFGTREK